MTCASSVSANSLSVANAAVVSGSLSAGGALQVSLTSALDGAVTCGSSVSANSLSVTNAAVVSGSLSASGAFHASSTSALDGAVTCASSVSANSLSVVNGAVVLGALSASGAFHASSTSALDGAVTCAGSVSANSLSVVNDAVVSGALSASGAFHASSTSALDGAVTCAGSVSANSLSVVNNALVSGAFHVVSTSALDDDVSCGGSLTVSGAINGSSMLLNDGISCATLDASSSITVPALVVNDIQPGVDQTSVSVNGLQIAGSVIELKDSSSSAFGPRVELMDAGIQATGVDSVGGHLVLSAGASQGFQESGVDIKVPDISKAVAGVTNSSYAKLMIPTQFPLTVSSGAGSSNDLLTVTLPLGQAASLWLTIAVVAQSSDPTSIFAASNSRMLQISMAHTNSKLKLNMVSSGIAAAYDTASDLSLQYSLSAIGDVVTLSANVSSGIASPVSFADLVLISHTGAPVQFLSTGVRGLSNI